MNFFIPSYQRGYRWTTQQVKDLLEDIKDFSITPSNFYCLQPIVVRKMNEEEVNRYKLDGASPWYEVIDGQQRLTSIYLILKAFRDVIKISGLSLNLYNLEFEREILSDAKSLADIENIDEEDSSTIDRLHISRAMKYIQDWKERGSVNYLEFCNALLRRQPDPEDPDKDKANNVRVIWYESVDEDPVMVFTRLNIGKISLTNAELIKALLLNRKNFKKTEEDELVRLRQQEISSEWDAIESHLQDDRFWMFLNDAEYDHPTRIDFIFDMMEQQNALELLPEELEDIGDDQYKTFRYFYAYFKNKRRADIKVCWGKVNKYYQAFKEWYDTPELYHYIGYLLYYSVPDIMEITRQWNDASDKKTFLKYLKEQIKKKLGNCPSLEFQYKTDGSDKWKCRPILFFHNIQTAINMNRNNSSKTIGMAYRFPFDAFKSEHWDVEHINSNTTNPEEDNETRKEWLFNVYMSVPSDLQRQICDFFDGNPKEETAVELFEKVRSYIRELDKWSAEEKNRIWNYTLLDSGTNRSYGNAIFSGKRRVIISKDSGKTIEIPKIKKDKIEIPEAKEEQSCFVPPVTKQVFLKYYSASAGNNNYWDLQMDAPAYLEDIRNCIGLLDQEEDDK